MWGPAPGFSPSPQLCWGPAEVLALEVDGIACETALENVARNGVEDRVTVLEVQVEGGVPLPDAPFDGIVANLQSHLLLPLLSGFQSRAFSRKVGSS